MTELEPETRRLMNRVADPLPTKSAKIRALAAAGFKRARIADYLGIRYQHVRNVLTQPAPKSAPGALPERVVAKLGSEGRVLIPAAYRQALGLKEGEDVVLTIDGDGLRLESRMAGVRRAQAIVARRMPGPEFSSAAFIAERRREAARERREFGRAKRTR